MSEVDKAFEEFAHIMGCDSNDPDELNDWEDMGRDEIFKAGWNAAIRYSGDK